MYHKKRLTRRQFLSILPTVSMAMLDKVKHLQKITSYSPKFNIGDYIECQFPDIEEPGWYERGEINSIGTNEEGGWVYHFIVRECPHPACLGATGEASENQLILLVNTNW